MGRYARAVLIVVLLFLAAVLTTLSQPKPSPRNESDARLQARGKYIVDQVAMCGDCHTPRTEKGEPDRTRYLRGADMGVEPVAPIPVFSRITPDITAQGLAGWSVEDLMKALQTGRQPNGKPFRPPMPAYQMNREDAKAVAVYLKSVGSEKK